MSVHRSFAPPVRLGLVAVATLAFVVAWSDLPATPSSGPSTPDATATPSVVAVGGLGGGPSGSPTAGASGSGSSPAATGTPSASGATAGPSGPASGSPSANPSGSPEATAGPSTPGSSPTPRSTPRPTSPPTPAPTIPPGPGSWQPSFPIRAAFYYPWFPQAWKQDGLDPYTHYTPSLGLYNGASATVVASQVVAMKYAGIEAGIASWWGQGTLTDSRIPLLLAQAGSQFRWSLYYEAEAYGDPSVAQIASDLAYIGRRYASSGAFLRIDGRPVIFVYADSGDGCGMAQRWKQAGAGFYVVLKVFPGYKGCPAQPDAWHQDAAADRSDGQKGQSFSVSPGFWLATESQPRLARDPTAFASAVRSMVASRAPLQLITTFNEWGEGTSIESATQWASPSGYGTYLDILHANGR